MISILQKSLSNRSVLVFLLLSIIVTYIIFFIGEKKALDIILLLFEYVSITSLYGIFLSVDKSPFSLNKTYNIFVLFFFGIAPALQYKNAITFLGTPLLDEYDYLYSVIVIVIAHSVYLFLYHILRKFNFLKFKIKKSIRIDSDSKLIYSLCLLSLIAFIIFLILVKFDLEVIFKRPANHWQKENTRFGLMGYSLLLVVRAIPVICLIFYELIVVDKNRIYLLFLWLLILFTAFPFSLGRGTLAFYYLPVLVIYIPYFKRKLFYSLFFVSSILFAFPVLNFFRPNGSIDIGLNQFITPHFDAFHNFSFLLKEKIITNGEQLFGSFLFFVPSSIWENKPVGTGQMIAERLNFSYTNISMPFWGEGYANFGYFGIFMSVVFLAILNSFFDGNYNRLKNNYIFMIVFLFLLGFEFYLLRGDLYSSIKFSVSYFLALLIVYSFVNVSIKLISKKYD